MSFKEEIRHIRSIGERLGQLPAADPDPHVAALNDLKWQLAKALESLCQTLEELEERINRQVPSFRSDR